MTTYATSLNAVVPAKAGTHTPHLLGWARWRRFFVITKAGGYGSRLSQGRHARWIKRTTLALAAFIALVAPAWADGTLGLGEVLAAVDEAPKLVAEIQQELARSNLKVADLTCMGARHGNQWTYLGGGRAAPYNCEIGQRSLHIEADRIYFDARGKPLGDVEKADQKRAKTFQESNFRWTWTP
jgi:hypothetical protein